MKTPFKKDEKYRHTEDCKEQARGICDQCKRKSLKPVYAMQDMLVCTYEPKESRAMALIQMKETAKVFFGKKPLTRSVGSASLGLKSSLGLKRRIS